MYFDETAKPEVYIDVLFNACVNELLPTAALPPFKYLTKAEHWSIATQFLLGLTNIYAVARGKASQDTNFGEILDNRPDLSTELAQTLVEAQQNKENIEDACFLWLKQHAMEFKLTTVFTDEDIKTIKQDFAHRFVQIKDAPHFDEFFILDAQNKGDFVMHQGSICTNFARFVHSPLLEVPIEFTQPLEEACKQASHLGVSIPHKNTLAHNEVEINTAALDNAGLQTLYKHIDGYQDAKLKEKLFAQLKKERPDFKSKINASHFLQHVAYGQQDEAEALLQKDLQLAQELLKADNIAFTDCSGRTFTCTAYEYAWWARDSHMQRMLEKYIRQDEETRQFILERVQAIEEPQPLPLSANLFDQSKPQGLRYTTEDKQGNAIEHWEAHFDLTPLKKALKHYVGEYEKLLNKSKDNWEILDKIWVEEVGRAQRDVPAHIAQEYCHPLRSLKDVTENKSLLDASNPANLKRQLKFYNWKADQSDLWFTLGSYSVDSGLGFSFGIFRGETNRASDEIFGAAPRAHIDLAAVKAIDEVRTNDLKQSLVNLSQPLIVQAPKRRKLY
ncbi:SidC homolog [Legionella spiritensis]|nr:SidC homolog [Legionella spiritensis]